MSRKNTTESNQLTTPGAKLEPMKPTPELPDDDAEKEELLRQIELSSQLVAELSQQITETAMARIVGWRRLDLRAIKSLDLDPGTYQIKVSTPNDENPEVTLSWTPGHIILGADLIRTERDVRMPIPTIRDTVWWEIPHPQPGVIPPAPAVAGPEPLSESEKVERRMLFLAQDEAWRKHCQSKVQAAEDRMTTDQEQAAKDEEKVAEAMIAEIETRRANPKANAEMTITEVAEEVALKILEASKNPRA